MKPHMAHIKRTLERKEAVKRAKNPDADYVKYKKAIDRAYRDGYLKEHVLAELKAERERIENDARSVDALFDEGLQNAKQSCILALDRVINELETEE